MISADAHTLLGYIQLPRIFMKEHSNRRLYNLYRDQLLILHKMNLYRQYENYICPFCLKSFSEDTVDSLSLEDAPQESLGGSKVALTCKKCNNSFGRLIDCHLVNYIDAIEVRQFPEGLREKVTVVNPKTRMSTNAQLRIESGLIKLCVPKKINNPTVLERELPQWIENSLLNIEFAEDVNKRLPKNIAAAIMKNAYVLLFAKLGYIFLLNPYYDVLREQLFNPGKDILPEGLFHFGRIFPFDGIYAANDKFTRGFFVQYTLSKRQFHTCIFFIPAPCVSYEQAADSLKKIHAGSKLLCPIIAGNKEYLSNSDAIKQVMEWTQNVYTIWPPSNLTLK